MELQKVAAVDTNLSFFGTKHQDTSLAFRRKLSRQGQEAEVAAPSKRKLSRQSPVAEEAVRSKRKLRRQTA